MPSNFLAFDRIRTLARRHNIQQHQRIYQDQSNIAQMLAGGSLTNPGNGSSIILDQTNLQLNRLERYKDFEMMDQTSEINLALDLYADEGCVTGDTRIPLLDGSCPTIAELAARGRDHEFWLYAFDSVNNRYVPAKGRCPRVTGKNMRIVTVKMDDGSEIKCTPDHLFMLSDGTFARAGQLQPGTSLKPLYKKIRYRAVGTSAFSNYRPNARAGEYEFMYNGKHFISTHRWVYADRIGGNPEVVHHVNYNSRDNTPDNLAGMTVAAHVDLHKRLGPDNPSFKDITIHEITEALEGWSGPLSQEDVCELCDIGERVLNRVLATCGVTWTEFKSKWHSCACGAALGESKTRQCRRCRKQYLANYHLANNSDSSYRAKRLEYKRRGYKPVSVRTCGSCGESKQASQFSKNGCAYSPYCDVCRQEACGNRYLRKSFGNHKVVSVTDAGVAAEVYDIEVPGYHCFAAGTDNSWVIIHNSLVDPERKHTLIIRAHSRRLKRELEEFYFNTLQWDTMCRPSVRYLAKFGDCPYEIVPDRHRSGVSALKHMSVYNFTRVETKFGDLIGFFYQDEHANVPVFMHPWQVVHLRLTSFENIYAPYGRSIIDGGRKAFKQLRLMEDAALIYRITRAPEKRKFKIPVGQIAPKDVPEYMAAIARTFKRQRFYNPATGTFDEKYTPITQEDDFFLPVRPDGSGPDIDTLPGGENVDKIADIEYFKRKMVACTKIPFNRVGIGPGAGEANGKSVSQDSSEFAKAIQWVQREFVGGLTKAGVVHLLLRGYPIEDVKGFELAMSATSAMEELYRMETWQTRVSVMMDLKELGWFPKAWIITHFTDLTPDEIEELKEIEAMEMAGGDALSGGDDEGGGGGMGGAPSGGAPAGDLGGDMGDLDAAAMGDDSLDVDDVDLDPNADPAAEGFDLHAQKRVLTELRLLKKDRNKRALREYLEKLSRRLGKDSERSDFKPQRFTHLIESNELDGLKRGVGEDSKLVVESSLSDSDRESVLNETRLVLARSEALPVVVDEIVASDLPV